MLTPIFATGRGKRAHRPETFDETLRVDQHELFDRLRMIRREIYRRGSPERGTAQHHRPPDVRLPKRVQVRSLRLGRVIPDPSILRVREPPSPTNRPPTSPPSPRASETTFCTPNTTNRIRAAARNGAASLPAGPASPAHDVSTAFARPGTSTDTDRHRRAIAIAAGSSSSRTSGGKKLGKSVVDAARVVVAMRPARRAFARARGAARAARAGAARQIDARVILERGPSFSAPPRASRARASR